jgi:hypothetical protein
MSHLSTIKQLLLNSLQSHNDGLQRYPYFRLLINYGPLDECVEHLSLYNVTSSDKTVLRWVYRFFNFPKASEKFVSDEELLKILDSSKSEFKLKDYKMSNHGQKIKISDLIDVTLHDELIEGGAEINILNKWHNFSITPNRTPDYSTIFSLNDKFTKLSVCNGNSTVDICWVNDIPANLDEINSLFSILNHLVESARLKNNISIITTGKNYK